MPWLIGYIWRRGKIVFFLNVKYIKTVTWGRLLRNKIQFTRKHRNEAGNIHMETQRFICLRIGNCFTITCCMRIPSEKKFPSSMLKSSLISGPLAGIKQHSVPYKTIFQVEFLITLNHPKNFSGMFL